MSFVLGLDSGGTKTLAAIADQHGRVLRRWRGRGLDPMAASDWADTLAAAIRDLCRGEQPAAAVLGLPVHGEIEAVSARQRDVAQALFACPHLVLNDVEISYDGAFPGRDGVLLLAGTGSMAWAKTNGESLRVGGWGDALGDEGSAFWIGHSALALTTQVLDGRRDAPDFAAAVLDACGCRADGLVAWVYSRPNPRAEIAALAERIDTLAEAGNQTAVTLIEQAADLLAEHADAARRRLDRPGLGWSYAGSVFRSSLLLRRLATRLGPPESPRLQPVGGALWRAAVLAGWAPDDAFLQSLSASPDTSNT